ncbi:histidinol-phosphatase [Mangrovibrevibacter kandeliae]|uniref:histidinol-phosphatase n=1 Tax=Mangrovibrevibacter kandeliae TaxID=2968473 RepID=UPI002119B1F0|nr:histidinol-phosphatase [Aurantimonas sp. CSK15Z-1]MCQ8783307.1 histidinol-phosphatase [Aurantimonas sp. CSK15Z-1]
MTALPTLDFLIDLTEAAAAETLPRFRLPLDVDNKRPADFDPVTEADRAAERAIRTLIERTHPDHAILGEEYGASGAGDRCWVIDPIDGTRAFISGLPLWGTLIGFTVGGVARAGIMHQPFTGERFFADDSGAYAEGPGERHRLAVRQTRSLDAATLFTTTPRLFTGALAEPYERLERRVRLARYGADCYAFAMLAAGQIDLVVEAGLQPYDIVALIPIIEQAGGVVRRIDGSRAETGGDIIAAATPDLWEEAAAFFRRADPLER